MKFINIKHIVIVGLIVLQFSVSGLALSAATAAGAGGNGQTPDLPSPLCDSLRVPHGNKAFFQTFAFGVQIYRWNGASWDFVEPAANLYVDADFDGKIGFHYAGPTWESDGGSRVIAARVPDTGCTPDSSAIPWLLLQTVSTEGRGIFSRVTYIQRVNTGGGLKPAAPGSFIGEERRVPYTAEYYFYRAPQR